MRSRAGPALLAAGLLALLALLLARSCAPEGERPRGPEGKPPSAPSPAAPRGPAPLPAPAPAGPPPSSAVPEEAAAGAVPPEGKGRLRVRGRVVDGEGAAVGGAGIEVRAWSGEEPAVRWTLREGRTGPDGAFEVAVDRALATRGFGVASTAEGHVEGWVSVKAEEYDEERGIEVVAERARAVAGRVLDEYGRGIPGTAVQLWYGSDTTWPSTTDAEGRFRTPRRGPRRAFELVVEPPGFPARTVPVPASADDPSDVGDLVFRRGGRIAGVAVDHRGDPVPDLPLCLLDVAGGGGKSPRARTDGAGRFEFPDVGEGAVRLCVDAPGEGGPPGARRRYRGVLGDVRAGGEDLRFPVRAECTVVLRFVDAATGKPVDVRKAEYGVRPEGTEGPATFPESTSSSDPLLSVRTSVLTGSRYEAAVRSPGFEVARVEGIDPGDGPEVVLDVPLTRSP